MRPLYLKMRGINSFIEEQEIDFSRLTENGFFGIFGPTGSGKSTILDGITLALYGTISRKSGGFINTNVTSAGVSFRFFMEGKTQKTYLVEREFRLDKKTGNPRSGRCMIADVTGEETVVLADGIREVNEVCQRVIGLSYDDFTRTVVLPQGKFSDFLTLKGTDRNTMLERIFRLEQYGETLTEKLKRREEKELAKLQRLQGEINGHGAIEKEEVAQKEAELKGCSEKTAQFQKQVEQWQETWNNAERIWTLQEECKGLLAEKALLEQEKEQMAFLEAIISQGEKALGVQPFWLEYETSEEECLKAQEILQRMETAFLEIQQEVATIKGDFEKIKETREEKRPILQQKQGKARDALILEKQWKTLEEEGISKGNELQQERNTIAKQEISLSQRREELLVLEEKIAEGEARKEMLFVSQEEKEIVQEGVLLERELLDKKEQWKEKEEKRNALAEEIVSLKKEEELGKGVLEKTKMAWGDLEKSLELHQKTKPKEGALEVLLQEKTVLSLQWQRYQKIEEEQGAAAQKIFGLQEQLQERQREKERIEAILTKMEIEKEQQEFSLAVQKIQASLLEGNPCPVCGAKEHFLHEGHWVQKESFFDEAEWKKEKKVLEQHCLAIKALEVEYQQEETQQQKRELEQRGFSVDFSSFSMKEMEKNYEEQKNYFDKFYKKEKNFEKRIGDIKEEYYKMRNHVTTTETKGKEKQEQLTLLSKELVDFGQTISMLEEKYRMLQGKVGGCSFTEKQKEVTKRETEKNELEEKIRKWNQKLREVTAQREKIRGEWEKGNNRIGVLATEVDNIRSRWLEKKSEIFEKIGQTTGLEQYLLAVEAELEQLEKTYETMEKGAKEGEEKLSSLQIGLESNRGRIVEMEKNRRLRKDVFFQKLQEGDFGTQQQWQEALLSPEDLAERRQMLSQYQDRMQKNSINMEIVLGKLAGKRLTLQQWEEINISLTEKKESLLAEQERKTQLAQLVSQLQEKLQMVEKLLEQEEKIEHSLSMLGQLKRLFAGKKFVQFVAMERLKYITLEATKLLMEISNGNYGLSVGENGNFYIRDFKNGGVEREAATLSGGETFLASLSLALALSTQIQMNQEAPLGFFFLDEGFGTLDDMLLEEVLCALERLPNKNRSIGLISHVAEIKERVPVKLVVTGAQMGKQGSQVNIIES